MTPEPESEPPVRHRASTRRLVPIAALVAIAIVAAALASGGTRHASSGSAGPPVVVLGRPVGAGFEMVVVRRGDDPTDGVVVSREGTGRGVIDLRRSLERDLSGGVALGPRVARIDGNRVAYSVEEGYTRSLVLVDLDGHRATRLYTGSNEASFYSDEASGWLMIHDVRGDGATCLRIRPASSSPKPEKFSAKLECGFEPGGAVVTLDTDGHRVRATYRAPGAPPVSYGVGIGMPTLDGNHHQVIAQLPVGSDHTRIVALDSATGRKRYVGPAADAARAFGFAPDGSFFTQLLDGDATRVFLVRDNQPSVVARQPVTAAVSKNGTALLVVPGTTSDRVERVRPDGHIDRLLDAPDVELRLLPGDAGAIFAWSEQTTVYTGYADHGPLEKAGSLPEAFTAAFTHPSSSTGLFLGFDGEPDDFGTTGAVYSARVGGRLTKLWEGAGIRLLDITNDGRQVVMFHAPDNYGYENQTSAAIYSATVPTGREAPDPVWLDSIPHALGALVLERNHDRVLYTAYRGAPNGQTVRVDPEVRSVPITGGKTEARYDGWSLLDLGDSSSSLVVVAGHDPGI